jgi:hypothetical protein
MEQKTAAPTPDDAKDIIDAAEQLALLAAKLVKGNPFFALGALSLATAQVGVFVKIPYNGLIQLISDHYESVMLLEVEREFKEAGGTEPFLAKQTDGKKD